MKHTPNLFNFDHHYDPELTPRKGWQQRVTNIESLYEQEKQFKSDLEQDWQKDKQNLTSQLATVKEKLSGAENKANGLEKENLALKQHNEELIKSGKRMKEDLDKLTQRLQSEKTEFNHRITNLEH